VIALTGTKAKIARGLSSADDMKRRRPDMVKARELLGRRPTIALREGLIKTIAYFDALMSRSGASEGERGFRRFGPLARWRRA
jgi:UDP-glucuronate decarboxylase